MAPIVLLGPQRLRRTLGEAVARAGVTGRVATITAGWQEREREDEELDLHLEKRTVNLALWQRGENVFAADPEFFAAHRARQDRLRQLQEIYRSRLALAKQAARELLSREGERWLLEPERRSAIAAVRRLDEHHLERVHELHLEFAARWRPFERPAVVTQRTELAEVLADCEAVAIAGGHVAILINRLRLFGLRQLIGERTVFAWSAGAMAASEHIVLFHDSPPQGAGNAEMLEVGLGLCRGVVPFPHARRRLRLHDPLRVELLARRFAPAQALALDDGAHLICDGDAWHAGSGVRALTPEGAVIDVEEPT
jgi:hypothetical protein